MMTTSAPTCDEMQPDRPASRAHRPRRAWLALLLALGPWLSQCGGGDEAAAEAAMPSQAVPPAAPSPSAPASPITPAQLFDWAQKTWAELFPAGARNQTLTVDGVTYTARYYPATQNYLGVDHTLGQVWGYGPFTGLQLAGYGAIGDFACAADPTTCSPPLGKNRFTTTVDGDTREYWVHLPQGYDGLTPLPVVLMLHGSGGNGERFYNISGWVQTGEAQRVITVFPSSWVYDCVFDDGVNKRNSAKWTSDDLVLCAGNGDHLRDDVKFLRQVIDELSARLKVDARRVYLVGFSNGGEMAARAAVELGDRLAAVVANAGGLNAARTPRRRDLPVTLQLGNKDDNVLAMLGMPGGALPMDFAQLFATYPALDGVPKLFRQTFDIGDTYTVSGSASTWITATYAGRSGAPSHLFRFTLVNGLDHAYPNGSNHPMKASDEHWAWMKVYTLP